MNNTLHMIAYISNPIPTFTPEMMEDIITTSKINNSEHGITGALFMESNIFLQILEGDKQALQLLMQKISSDSRHENVDILLEHPIDQRGFADWNMDFFDLNNNITIDRDTMKKLNQEFIENLVPRGDIYARFYKALLQCKDQENIYSAFSN